jgi:hypothetical protein
MVEVPDMSVDRAILRDDLERRMKEVLGVKVTVLPVDRGALHSYTGVAETSKIKRLLDKRK